MNTSLHGFETKLVLTDISKSFKFHFEDEAHFDSHFSQFFIEDLQVPARGVHVAGLVTFPKISDFD